MNGSQGNLIILFGYAKDFILTHKLFGTGDKRFHRTPVTIVKSVVCSHHQNTFLIRYNATNTFGSQRISTLKRKKSVSNQKPYAPVRTDIKNTIDHIGTVYLGIHFNGGIFSVQVLHHTPVPLEIQNIVSLMDAPHVSKKTNGTLQSIGHAMIGQRTVRIRFIIAEFIDAPHINSFLGGRSQNGTHIGSIVQWKHIPDIAIKLHHTVLVGEIYPLVIIGCYLPSLGPLAINTFIKIDDKAIPAGNCFDQRGKKKKAEKKVE